MSDADMSWGALQEVFALASPVLAMGPGCHRIGYDTTEQWQRVVQRAWLVWHRLKRVSTGEETRARRDFLSHLWQSRLGTRGGAWDGSVRTGPSVGSGAPSLEELRGAATADVAGEEAQVVLATDLLCALVDATRALGGAVTAGSVPVVDWQLVRFPEHGTEDGKLRSARAWLTSAAALARDLATIQEAGTGLPLPAFRDRDLRPGRVDPEHLTVLKAEQIAGALDTLVTTSFGVSATALTGAVVEWLSDLFWHVMIAGASVPFAQDELNFYVNLRGAGLHGSRTFSRPHPGEYRGRSRENQVLRDDLTALLGSYDSGVAPDDGLAPRDWKRPREAFARTMAATLLETWDSGGHDQLAIGLVSDYDLMHERALMQLVREDQGFHVVCPVATNPMVADGEKPQQSFEWLYGTYSGDDRASVASPTWQWLSDVPPMHREPPLGPILIRLTGSPLFQVPRSPDQIRGAAPPGVTRIRPAVLFSEHESVQAILALTRPHLGGESAGRQLYHELFGVKGLSWERRGWLFFGHRFADWLPRLQLLFTALMLGRQASPLVGQGRWPSPFDNSRVAISRGFDWPEEALLTALDIGRKRADLDRISTYYDIKSSHSKAPTDESDAIRGFLRRVKGRVAEPPDPTAVPATSGPSSEPPQHGRRVFVSYSHESREPSSEQWRESVLEFANVLNRMGVDTTIDQYDNHLGRDWTTWSTQQIVEADVVICVASPSYAKDWGRTTGSGAADEARALRAELSRRAAEEEQGVEQGGRPGKSLVFVVLPKRKREQIPPDMRSIHHEVVTSIDVAGMRDLVRLLRGEAKFTKPTPEIHR